MINKRIYSPTEFTVAHTAIRDTEWLAEPANPINPKKGRIRQGDTIWFHPGHFGSGPTWQQARLHNKALRFVRLHDFKKVVSAGGSTFFSRMVKKSNDPEK